jgi:hypothetical protein
VTEEKTYIPGELYTCEGCGAVFMGDEEAAFQAGWDTPERFRTGTTCDSCPITVTAWWKVTVLKEPITKEIFELFDSYGFVERRGDAQATDSAE